MRTPAVTSEGKCTPRNTRSSAVRTTIAPATQHVASFAAVEVNSGQTMMTTTVAAAAEFAAWPEGKLLPGAEATGSMTIGRARCTTYLRSSATFQATIIVTKPQIARLLGPRRHQRHAQTPVPTMYTQRGCRASCHQTSPV